MQHNQPETFCPSSKAAWRQWLEENHHSKQSVWLVYYKKKSKIPSISWSEAVDEALCFGWIDSVVKQLDAEKFMQFFCKRKPKSVWSKINKVKVQRFIEQGLIHQAGMTSIEIAKQNGSWIILDEVEQLIIPKDLEKEFKLRINSKKYFQSLTRSVQKSILQWLILAKRPETRQKRIIEIAELAAQQLKPKQFR